MTNLRLIVLPVLSMWYPFVQINPVSWKVFPPPKDPYLFCSTSHSIQSLKTPIHITIIIMIRMTITAMIMGLVLRTSRYCRHYNNKNHTPNRHHFYWTKRQGQVTQMIIWTTSEHQNQNRKYRLVHKILIYRRRTCTCSMIWPNRLRYYSPGSSFGSHCPVPWFIRSAPWCFVCWSFIPPTVCVECQLRYCYSRSRPIWTFTRSARRLHRCHTSKTFMIYTFGVYRIGCRRWPYILPLPIRKWVRPWRQRTLRRNRCTMRCWRISISFSDVNMTLYTPRYRSRVPMVIVWLVSTDSVVPACWTICHRIRMPSCAEIDARNNMTRHDHDKRTTNSNTIVSLLHNYKWNLRRDVSISLRLWMNS